MTELVVLTRAPRPELLPFVSEVRMGISPGVGIRQAIEHLPDGRSSILFRLTRSGAGDLSAIGPRSIARYKQADAVPLFVNVLFRPGGGSPFFRTPLFELTDRVVELERLWGEDGSCLLARLGEAPDGDAAANLLEATLVEQLRGGLWDRPSAALVRQAARLMAGAPANAELRIDDLAARLGVSTRHFRRTCLDVVGVTPKQLARMQRLTRALDGAAKNRFSWSEIAAESGFSDQSHLIAEAKALVGMTPQAFLHRREATPTPYRAC
jgi:AraC-like DNA-binding protein